jgi:hypothetical protein
LVAALRPQLSVTASSGTKNSLTPGSSASGAQFSDRAPGVPAGGSSSSGVSSASEQISDASHAASIARFACTWASAAAFCSRDISASAARRSRGQQTSTSTNADPMGRT